MEKIKTHRKKSFYCSRSFCTAFILQNPLDCNTLLHARSFKVKFRARCAFQHEGEKVLSRSHQQSRLQNHESSVRLCKDSQAIFSCLLYWMGKWFCTTMISGILCNYDNLILYRHLIFLFHRYHSGTQAEPGRRPGELPVYAFKQQKPQQLWFGLLVHSYFWLTQVATLNRSGHYVIMPLKDVLPVKVTTQEALQVIQ